MINSSISNRIAAFVVALLLLNPPPLARAAEGGYSNYIPGFYGDIALAVEPGDGLSMRNDVYLYRADTERSIRSGSVQLDIDIDLTFDYLTMVYKPDIEIFGTQFVFGGTLVAGNVDLNATLAAGPLQTSIADDKTSYGDITLVPGAFYWNNGDKWHFSQSFYVVIPVGDYDVNDVTNTGLNYWTFETDFAATYLNPETGKDYSFVLGYGYNTENDDTNFNSGAEIHLDYVFNQFLNEDWAVGLHGFFYKQISGDSGAGAVLGDFKSEGAGVGPALMWVPQSMGGTKAFVLKWIKEYHGENRLEGDHIFASFAMSF